MEFVKEASQTKCKLGLLNQSVNHIQSNAQYLLIPEGSKV